MTEVSPETEAVVEESQPAATPSAPFRPDVGDDVWVVFWREFRMPDQSDRGNWDSLPAQVISRSADGTRVCVQVGPNTPSTLCNSDGRESPPGSLLRFPDPADLYADRESATEAAKSRPKPLT